MTTPGTKFRFTEEDKRLLRKVADGRGLNVSELIRTLAREEYTKQLTKRV